MRKSNQQIATEEVAKEILALVESEVTRERSVQQLYLDALGREVPNPTPVAPPVGYIKHKTIAEQIREQIRAASLEAAQAGAESEEEANDFEVGEDYDPHSPHEHDFDPDPALEHMLALASRPPSAVAPAAPAAATTPAPAVPPLITGAAPTP